MILGFIRKYAKFLKIVSSYLEDNKTDSDKALVETVSLYIENNGFITKSTLRAHERGIYGWLCGLAGYGADSTLADQYSKDMSSGVFSRLKYPIELRGSIGRILDYTPNTFTIECYKPVTTQDRLAEYITEYLRQTGYITGDYSAACWIISIALRNGRKSSAYEDFMEDLKNGCFNNISYPVSFKVKDYLCTVNSFDDDKRTFSISTFVRN
jgi:hypothetical protein